MNKRHILGGLLFASLAVNLFLGSLLIGRQLPVLEKMRAAAERIEALPEPQRSEAGAVIKQYRPQIQKDIQALQEARKETYAAITGDGYDRARAEAQFKSLRDQTAAIQQKVQTMVLDLADKLTPAQRARIMHGANAAEKDMQP